MNVHLKEKVLECRYCLWNGLARHSANHSKKYGYGLLGIVFLLVFYQIFHLVISLRNPEFASSVNPVTPHSKVLYQFEYETHRFNWENRNKIRKMYKSEGIHKKSMDNLKKKQYNKKNSKIIDQFDPHPHSQNIHSLTNPNNENDYFYPYFQHDKPIFLKQIFDKMNNNENLTQEMDSLFKNSLSKFVAIEQGNIDSKGNDKRQLFKQECNKLNIFWNDISYISIPRPAIAYYELKHTIPSYLFGNDAFSGVILRIIIEKLTSYYTGNSDPTAYDGQLSQLINNYNGQSHNQGHNNDKNSKKKRKKKKKKKNSKEKKLMSRFVHLKCDLSVIGMKTEAIHLMTQPLTWISIDNDGKNNYKSKSKIKGKDIDDTVFESNCHLNDEIKKYNINYESTRQLHSNYIENNIKINITHFEQLYSYNRKQGINGVFLIRDPWITFWLLFQFDTSFHNRVNIDNDHAYDESININTSQIYKKYGYFTLSKQEWIEGQFGKKFKLQLYNQQQLTKSQLIKPKMIDNWLKQFEMMQQFKLNQFDFVVIKYENLFDFQNYQIRMIELEKLLTFLITDDYYGSYEKDFLQRINCLFWANDKIYDELEYNTWLVDVIEKKPNLPYITINDAYKVFDHMELCHIWSLVRDQAILYDYRAWNNITCDAATT